MNRQTIKILEDFRSNIIFSRVSVRDLDGVDYVSDWKDAINVAKSEEWDYTVHELAGNLTATIRSNEKELFDKWNEKIRNIKYLIDNPIRSRIEELNLSISQSNALFSSMQWDLMHACMEGYCESSMIPRTFSMIYEYYALGHFPCGFRDFGKSKRFIVY